MNFIDIGEILQKFKNFAFIDELWSSWKRKSSMQAKLFRSAQVNTREVHHDVHVATHSTSTQLLCTCTFESVYRWTKFCSAHCAHPLYWFFSFPPSQCQCFLSSTGLLEWFNRQGVCHGLFWIFFEYPFAKNIPLASIQYSFEYLNIRWNTRSCQSVLCLVF